MLQTTPVTYDPTIDPENAAQYEPRIYKVQQLYRAVPITDSYSDKNSHGEDKLIHHHHQHPHQEPPPPYEYAGKDADIDIEVQAQAPAPTHTTFLHTPAVLCAAAAAIIIWGTLFSLSLRC